LRVQTDIKVSVWIKENRAAAIFDCKNRAMPPYFRRIMIITPISPVLFVLERKALFFDPIAVYYGKNSLPVNINSTILP
jgi:hypothetical protein